MFPTIVPFICFFHAVSGCDTTSAFYRQGKKKLFNVKFVKDELLEFYNHKPDVEKLFKIGRLILYQIYAPNLKINEIKNLGDLRYICYRNRVQKASCELESLPPTDDAAKQHFSRVYYQIQLWLGNDSLDPENWGWKKNRKWPSAHSNATRSSS